MASELGEALNRFYTALNLLAAQEASLSKRVSDALKEIGQVRKDGLDAGLSGSIGAIQQSKPGSDTARNAELAKEIVAVYAEIARASAVDGGEASEFTEGSALPESPEKYPFTK